MNKHFKFSDPRLLLECDTSGNPIAIRSNGWKRSFVVPHFNSIADIPVNFVGVARVGNQLIIGDDTAKSFAGSFAGSIYSDAKSATTDGSLQVEAIPTGGEWLDALNNDATNSCYIGFGTSAAEAIANRDSGVAGVNRFLMLKKTPLRQPLIGYTHYAWIGVGGTVSVQISIGV